MGPVYCKERLLILDADGTTIDAFGAIERTFAAHNMDIGDLTRFQKRRHLFKYLGGLKEFPANMKAQLGKQRRARLIATLTEVYREEASLYEDMGPWITRLIEQPGLRVGMVTRNITNEPEQTLSLLLQRHDVDAARLDFLVHIPLKKDKTATFRHVREQFAANPARCYACGDEKRDYAAAVSSGMHPFMVSYGFEDFDRLTAKAGIPAELIARTPTECRERVCHALDIMPDSLVRSRRPQTQRSARSGRPLPGGSGEGEADPGLPDAAGNGRRARHS